VADPVLDRLRAANPVEHEPAVPSVDALFAGWGTARETEPGGHPAAARHRSWLRSTGLSVVVALTVGTGSAAVALAALTGSPIPGRGADDVTVRPAAGTSTLSSVRAVDPDAGPPWGLRIGTAPAGLQCLGVGQVQDDHLGLMGLDDVFRTVEPAGADDCGVPPAPTRFTAQARTFLGKTAKTPVTVVYGVRGSGLTTVRVRYADGMSTVLPVGADGGFVIARRGTLEQLQPRLESAGPGDTLASVAFAASRPSRTVREPGPAFDPAKGPR
jgi:hypothetical protein